MTTDSTINPAAALRRRGAAVDAHHRMAYRFASAQYRPRFIYSNGRWLSVGGPPWVFSEPEPDELRVTVLDVLQQAVADAPDDDRLRADVDLCSTPAGMKHVLAVAATLHPFNLDPAVYAPKSRRWQQDPSPC